MLVVINERWAVSSDSRQYILMKKGKDKDDNIIWVNAGYYYTSMIHLMKDLVEKEIKSSDSESLSDILKIMKKIKKDISDVVQPLYDINNTFANVTRKA